MYPYLYNCPVFSGQFRPDGIFPGGMFPGGMFPGGQFITGGMPSQPQQLPGGMQGASTPPGPPPSVMPPKPVTAQGTYYAVDPGAIFLCLFKFTVIYPTGGLPFWAWLVFVGPRSVAGFRWNGFSWSPFGLDLNLIDYFQCV